MRTLILPDALPRATGARALSRSLESQMVALCARAAPYRIEALALDHGAPESLEALYDQTRPSIPADSGADAGAGSLVDPRTGALVGERVPVWSGASERTIWSSAAVNALFRAWHDSHHMLLGAGFDAVGERAVAEHALGRIEGKPERAILWAETWGQVAYHLAHGAFPDDQRAFVRDAVRYGLELTIGRGVYHAVR